MTTFSCHTFSVLSLFLLQLICKLDIQTAHANILCIYQQQQKKTATRDMYDILVEYECLTFGKSIISVCCVLLLYVSYMNWIEYASFRRSGNIHQLARKNKIKIRNACVCVGI